jgi:hypothetical protein
MFYVFCETENSIQNQLLIKKINKFAILSTKNNFYNVIYGLVDPNSFEIRYVGLTKNLRKRFNNHLKNTDRNPHKTNWINLLAKNNLKPIVLVIKQLENYEDLYQEEIDQNNLTIF